VIQRQLRCTGEEAGASEIGYEIKEQTYEPARTGKETRFLASLPITDIASVLIPSAGSNPTAEKPTLSPA
jgi:hypothetical protein